MNKITTYLLFTDGSSNPQTKTGMGAYLLLADSYLKTPVAIINRNEILNKIKIKKFENTSSTKLEIETVLWALIEFSEKVGKIDKFSLKLFTDSQCVSGIIGRRAYLEKSNFISKGSGKELHNTELYKKFYELYDELHFEVIKVTGHSPSATHDTVTRIFSILDREVRRNLKSL